jgi:hypothetical protein
VGKGSRRDHGLLQKQKKRERKNTTLSKVERGTFYKVPRIKNCFIKSSLSGERRKNSFIKSSGKKEMEMRYQRAELYQKQW